MRGQLTDSVAALAHNLLGKDIDVTELRLMPYIQYAMVNEQRIDPNKINPDERRILADWRQRGWIEGGASGLSITKTFWDAIVEIIWLSYVVNGQFDQGAEV